MNQKICIQYFNPTKIEINKGKLAAAFKISSLWPSHSEIKIAFLNDGMEYKDDSGYNNFEFDDRDYARLDPLFFVVKEMSYIDAVKKIIMERYQPIVNLKFIFTSQLDESDIRIQFKKGIGSWSVIGTECKNISKKDPTLNLGWFNVQVVLHEFGHAVGLIHEHQSPFSNPIQWDKEKVYEWARETQGWDKEETDTNIINTESIEAVNGSKFDPQSIMCYFLSADLMLNRVPLQENYRLSPLDVQYIASNYPKGAMTPEEFYLKVYGQHINSGYVNVSRVYLYGGVFIIVLIALLIFLIR